MAESLICSTETITTMLISYTPMQNKKFKKKVTGGLLPPSALLYVKQTEVSVCNPERVLTTAQPCLCPDGRPPAMGTQRNKLLFTSHPVCLITVG